MQKKVEWVGSTNLFVQVIGHLLNDAVHIVKVDFLQGISRRLPALQAAEGVGLLFGRHKVLVRVIQAFGQIVVAPHNVSH